MTVLPGCRSSSSLASCGTAGEMLGAQRLLQRPSRTCGGTCQLRNTGGRWSIWLWIWLGRGTAGLNRGLASLAGTIEQQLQKGAVIHGQAVWQVDADIDEAVGGARFHETGHEPVDVKHLSGQAGRQQVVGDVRFLEEAVTFLLDGVHFRP